MIEVRNLTKRFGASTAVDDLSFEVRPGVVTGFLGPNGAGKSTTMRMMVGLDTPTSGQALINGTPYRELDRPAHKVGCLLDASWTHANRSAAARDAGIEATCDAEQGVFLIQNLRAPQVGDVAASLGITVHELHEKRASLEEAFMALTDQDVEYHGQESTR